MVNERSSERPAPACRWRTSAETLDLIEAMERIEALLSRLDERLRELRPLDRVGGSEQPAQGDRPPGREAP